MSNVKAGNKPEDGSVIKLSEPDLFPEVDPEVWAEWATKEKLDPRVVSFVREHGFLGAPPREWTHLAEWLEEFERQ